VNANNNVFTYFSGSACCTQKGFRGIAKAKAKEEEGMKKIAFTLLMVLNLTFFSNSASAQVQPLACLGEKAAGLTEHTFVKSLAFMRVAALFCDT
jgi:hypothetical protein